MPNRLTTEQFIAKAKEIHGDKYNYDKVNYINSQTRVKIVCKKHGVFEQKPNHHLRNQGCPFCSKNYRWNIINIEKVISKLYTNCKLLSFSNKTRKILLESNGFEHEIFLQNALKGVELSVRTVKNKTKYIIPILSKIHNNKYNYNKLVYKPAKNKVIITCPVHGDFKQSISDHKEGKGCPKCAKENKGGWSYSNWKKSAKNSNKFDSFKVYIVKCWNEEEEFYKIGKTFTTIDERFRKIDYNYKIIKIYIGKAKNMSILEKKLHKLNKDFVYLPKIKFNGHKECFKKVNYE